MICRTRNIVNPKITLITMHRHNSMCWMSVSCCKKCPLLKCSLTTNIQQPWFLVNLVKKIPRAYIILLDQKLFQMERELILPNVIRGTQYIFKDNNIQYADMHLQNTRGIRYRIYFHNFVICSRCKTSPSNILVHVRNKTHVYEQYYGPVTFYCQDCNRYLSDRLIKFI